MSKIPTVPAPRCGARNQQGEPCKRICARRGIDECEVDAIGGVISKRYEKRCRFHGGAIAPVLRGRPSSTTKHGLYGKFISDAERPAYLAVKNDIQERQGIGTLEDHAALLTSKVVGYLQRNPSGPGSQEDLEVLLKTLGSARAAIDTTARIVSDQRAAAAAPEQSLTINVADLGGTAEFTVRGPDRLPTRALRLGELTLIRLDDGAWHEAQATNVDGIELYQPILQLEPSSNE